MKKIKSWFGDQEDRIGGALLLLTLGTALAYWVGFYLFGLPARWVWLLNFAGRTSFSALLVFFGVETALSEKDQDFAGWLGLTFFEGFFVVAILKTWSLVPWWSFLVLPVAWVALITLYSLATYILIDRPPQKESLEEGGKVER